MDQEYINTENVRNAKKSDKLAHQPFFNAAGTRNQYNSVIFMGSP